MRSVRRLLSTLAYLQPIQVVDRFARIPRRAWARVAIRPSDIALTPRAPAPSAHCPVELDESGKARFVGEWLSLAGGAAWAPPDATRLAAYNLHYFQYLGLLERDRAADLITDWIDANPPMQGAGWEPYPISLRVREWLEWLLAEDDPALHGRILRSLSLQMEALRLQVEHHLQGNHLLENAITFAWAGFSLQGGRSDRWRRLGAALLGDCVRQQFLRDGSHEERPPMYQAILADAFLRLAHVLHASPYASAKPLADLATSVGSRALDALEAAVHPDGDYALMHDTAFGVAPTLEQLRTTHAPLLPDARSDVGHSRLGGGFARLDLAPGSRLIFDVGGVGPDHQPGHAHAGALGFELSHRSQRVFTDSGIGDYQGSERRRAVRATAAHNTIEIDGRDQSELWGAFRCGRRIKSAPPVVTEHGAVGMYRGPSATGGGVRHARRVDTSASEVVFQDLVRSAGEHSAALYLHLAPGMAVALGADARADITHAGELIARVHLPGGAAEVIESRYCPTFGEEVMRPCVRASTSFRDELMWRWKIELF